MVPLCQCTSLVGFIARGGKKSLAHFKKTANIHIGRDIFYNLISILLSYTITMLKVSSIVKLNQLVRLFIGLSWLLTFFRCFINQADSTNNWAWRSKSVIMARLFTRGLFLVTSVQIGMSIRMDGAGGLWLSQTYFRGQA
jgi:hypothetical protein